MEEIRHKIQEPYDEGEIDLLQLVSEVGKQIRRLWWLCVLLVLASTAAVMGTLFLLATPYTKAAPVLRWPRVQRVEAMASTMTAERRISCL